MIRPDRRSITSPANGKRGGRPKKEAPLVRYCARLTAEQVGWLTANEENGSKKLREIIEEAMTCAK